MPCPSVAAPLRLPSFAVPGGGDCSEQEREAKVKEHDDSGADVKGATEVGPDDKDGDR